MPLQTRYIAARLLSFIRLFCLADVIFSEALDWGKFNWTGLFDVNLYNVQLLYSVSSVLPHRMKGVHDECDC